MEIAGWERLFIRIQDSNISSHRFANFHLKPRWITYIIREIIILLHRTGRTNLTVQIQDRLTIMTTGKESAWKRETYVVLRCQWGISRMCGTDKRDHLVKQCLGIPRWGIMRDENWPCQPLAHKPPGCQKHVLWPLQVLEMPDKGHEPSPSPFLGGREKPGHTQDSYVWVR